MEDPGEVQEREIEVLQGMSCAPMALEFLRCAQAGFVALTPPVRTAIYGEEFQKAESRTAWKVRTL